MDFTDKAESLASKMNKLSEKFEIIDDITGDDVVDFIQEKTTDILIENETTSTDVLTTTEIINLKTMVDDFLYVRTTLKETTDNGRRVLNSVTLDLLDSDDDKRAQLIMSFAELNKAVGDNMKLYMQSYKDISIILLNIDKINKNEKDSPKTTQNTINNFNGEVVISSTVDLISKMRGGIDEL